MPLIHNNHMVEQFPPAVADGTFRNAVGEHRQLHRMAMLPIATSR
jgi:hypothetical protein